MPENPDGGAISKGLLKEKASVIFLPKIVWATDLPPPPVPTALSWGSKTKAGGSKQRPKPQRVSQVTYISFEVTIHFFHLTQCRTACGMYHVLLNMYLLVGYFKILL